MKINTSAGVVLSCSLSEPLLRAVFSLIVDELEDQGNGIYFVSLNGQQVMQCAVEFRPSEVE